MQIAKACLGKSWKTSTTSYPRSCGTKGISRKCLPSEGLLSVPFRGSPEPKISKPHTTGASELRWKVGEYFWGLDSGAGGSAQHRRPDVLFIGTTPQ